MTKASVQGSRIAAVSFAIACLLALPRHATAQLARQNLQVDLGSGAVSGTLPFDEPFNLTANAPAALLQVRLWYTMNDSIPRFLAAAASTGSTTPAEAPPALWCRLLQPPPSADAPAPPRAVVRPLQSGWSRAGLDSISSFSLAVAPLEPNKDYTFCFHILRKPASDAAAAFAAKLTTNLTTALWQHVIEVGTIRMTLDTVQGLLIGALPDADSIVLGGNSLFRRVDGESDQQRATRLDRINVFITAVEQQAGNRASNTDDFENRVTSTVPLLQQPRLNHRVLLQKLPQMASVLGRTADEKTSFAVAARAGIALANLREDQADRVARGIQTIEGPLVEQTTMDLDSVRTSAPMLAVAANLRRSLLVLSDLSDMLHLLETQSDQLRQRSIRAADVRSLTETLRRIELEFGVQLRNAQLFAETLDAMNKMVADLARSVATIDFARILLLGTTSATYTARAKWYIGLDVGLVGARQVHSVVPYFGANVYFRPVNKDAPLSVRGGLWRRFALMLGLTVSSINDTDRIQDLFSGRSALVGAGVRVTDYWRTGVGALVFRSYDGTGEERRLKVNAQPAVSASIDFDILSLFGKVGSLLFPTS